MTVAALTVVFVAVFDFFAMGVAAPVAQLDLTGSSRGAELIVALFATTYAAGLLTGGVLGDRYGRRRVLAAGIAGYVVCCVLCATAPTEGMLLAGRLLQGLTAAVMVPPAFATISRASAGGGTRLAAALGGASVTGQVLGAVSTSAGAWRVLFVAEVAIGVVALATVRAMPAGAPLVRRHPDPLGLLLGLLVPLSFLAPLAMVRLSDGDPLLLLISLAALPLAVAYRSRLRRVIGRRRRLVFTGWRPLLAAAGTGAAYAGQTLLTLGATTHLREQHQDTLILATYGASFAVVSLAGAGLLHRSPRSFGLAGIMLAAAGAALLLGGEVGPVAPLAMCGAAMGMMLPSLVASALGGAAPGSASRASGFLATSQQLAVATAAAAAGWLL
ncbi:MAG: MFS transporter [Actinomycetota bacterium]|nr:MFS transporter [Actinomycetota bacterium]